MCRWKMTRKGDKQTHLTCDIEADGLRVLSSVDVEGFAVKLILGQFGHIEGEVALVAHHLLLLLLRPRCSEPGEVYRRWVGHACARQSYRAAVRHRTRRVGGNGRVFWRV